MGVDVRYCNVEEDEIPIKNGEFDVIIISEVIEHLVDPIKVFSLKENSIPSTLDIINENKSKYQSSYAKIQKQLLKYKNFVKRTIDMVEKYEN